MIIKNASVFQEDGTFKTQDIYIEGDSQLDIQRNILHHIFHLVGQTDEIDAGTAAGGT